MTEKKPARRSAEREIMKQETIRLIISPKEIPVNESEEIGLCRFWGKLTYHRNAATVNRERIGHCNCNDGRGRPFCWKSKAGDLLYLRCRTYQSWLVKQNV